MKTHYTVAIALLAGVAIGSMAVQGLHAQAKPPVYVVTEIDVPDIDPFLKEYAPKAQALIKTSGGRFIAAGQNVTSIEGEPPKKRVTIQVWDSIEKIQAWRDSTEFKEISDIGDKYAKFRTFTVEGIPQ